MLGKLDGNDSSFDGEDVKARGFNELELEAVFAYRKSFRELSRKQRASMGRSIGRRRVCEDSHRHTLHPMIYAV